MFDHYSSLLEVSEVLRRRVVSPVEVTKLMLKRIERLDETLLSYNCVLVERALERARQAENEIARGFYRGYLHGVPLALKDLCDTHFAPSSAGMYIYRNFIPERSATVVDRLEAAGAVILGKLAMTEGAFTTHHPKLRTPRNPWHADYWTGISSSGSGVATAAGLCYGSLGSDTGGSIRLPSYACGLTGLKTTWGRVSRFGIFPLAPTFDTVGPMARNAADAAAILSAIAGADRLDPTALQAPVPDYVAGLSGGIHGTRIGFDDLVAQNVDPEVMLVLERARDEFARLGARIVPVRLPSPDKYLDVALRISAGETAHAHRDTFPSREDEYGPELAARLKSARNISSVETAEANLERLEFAGRLAQVFADVDLLLVPVIPTAIPKTKDVAESMKAPAWRRFTAPFNATGSPTITLRGGGGDKAGLPIAFQLVGRHLSEELLLRCGHAFQQVTDWHARHPKFPSEQEPSHA